MRSTRPLLNETELVNNIVRVGWQNSPDSLFHPIWLRDNCRCENCGDPAIGRRNLRLTDLDLQQTVKSLERRDNQLHILWTDNHRSSYTADWLIENAYDEHSRRNRAFSPKTWGDTFHARPPKFDFEAVCSHDNVLLEVLHKIRDHGLCFVSNAPARPGILESLALKIGYPQESNFGRIQDLVVDKSKSSVANDIIGLKPHTDEPYRASPPGVLMFHCIETDTAGAGTSLFMDGFKLAKLLRSEDPEGFAALCRYPQSFRRHFENDVDLIAEFPIFSVDEFGNLSGIRINDRVAAPLSIPADVVDVYYRGMKRLLELTEDEDRMMKLTLRPGDIAMFDNHRILHGRSRLTMTGKRWLQWVQIERGDFHSTLRILADKLNQPRDSRPLLRGSFG